MTVSNKRGDVSIIPAGMEWDAAEYADKDGLESGADGTVAFADSRNDAWHQLGQQVGHTMTAAEVMSESKLGGWDVRKAPLQTITEDGIFEVTDRFAVVRTNPFTAKAEPLPGVVVGNYYTPIQNETATETLDLITDQTGAHFETAGSLMQGRQVFVTMKLPKTMRVGGVDDVELYLSWMNSHDGTSAQRTILTPVRTVCQNTQRAAFAKMVSEFRISHTKGAHGRIAEVRAGLGLTFAYADAFEAAAERMIAASMTKDQFVKVTKLIWTPPKKDGDDAATSRTVNSYAKRLDTLVELFTTAETNENIRGTAWAGYQAVTEYLDHVQPVQLRGFDSPETARAARTVTGRTNDVKDAAWTRVLAFASK